MLCVRVRVCAIVCFVSLPLCFFHEHDNQLRVFIDDSSHFLSPFYCLSVTFSLSLSLSTSSSSFFYQTIYFFVQAIILLLLLLFYSNISPLFLFTYYTCTAVMFFVQCLVCYYYYTHTLHPLQSIPHPLSLSLTHCYAMQCQMEIIKTVLFFKLLPIA